MTDAPGQGWDFSALAGRMVQAPTSWDYTAMAQAAVRQARAVLDLGTGGGEFLASLRGLPVDTVATEGYPPNLPVARQRLERLGVTVLGVSGDALPLEDARFDLVLSRHASYAPAEVARVLAPGGTFLTQQVGGDDLLGLNEALDAPRSPHAGWNLDVAMAGLEAAGLRVVQAREEFPATQFRDIGAVVLYLRLVPWQIPDLDVQCSQPRMLALEERLATGGPLTVRAHRFLLRGQRCVV